MLFSIESVTFTFRIITSEIHQTFAPTPSSALFRGVHFCISGFHPAVILSVWSLVRFFHAVYRRVRAMCFACPNRPKQKFLFAYKMTYPAIVLIAFMKNIMAVRTQYNQVTILFLSTSNISSVVYMQFTFTIA